MTNPTPFPGHFAFYPTFACFLGVLLFAGCGKPPEAPKSPVPAITNAVSASVSAEAAGPGPGEKICFACKGEGVVPCRAPGCVEGQVGCPGPCLKMSRGAWIHMDVAGHDPNELWQKFPNQSGQGGYQAWNQNHVGEVVVYQNGVAVNIGKCKVCGGTTKATCSACKGTGKQTCPICDGKKFIPAAWTITDNPFFNRQPDVIRFTDGRVLLGRVAATVGDDLTIVTRDKKILHVKAADILSKAETNSPAVPTAPSK
jgi:hypothetical protein